MVLNGGRFPLFSDPNRDPLSLRDPWLVPDFNSGIAHPREDLGAFYPADPILLEATGTCRRATWTCSASID